MTTQPAIPTIPVLKSRYVRSMYIIILRLMRDLSEGSVSLNICSETECVFEFYNSNYFINVRFSYEGGYTYTLKVSNIKLEKLYDESSDNFDSLANHFISIYNYKLFDRNYKPPAQ